MKNYSLIPKEENVFEMFKTDSVGRNKYISRFLDLLGCINNFCSIALDSDWGNGKTFFVKQAKLLIDVISGSSDVTEEQKAVLKSFLPDYSLDYRTVYYDAWAHDKDENPVFSLMYSTLKDTSIKFDTKDRNLADCLIDVGEIITGWSWNIKDLIKDIEGEDLLEAIKQNEDIHLLVKNFFDALIVENGNHFIFFIDELDRCKPTYAIQLLESIKHYFYDDRFVFVFSVNLSQLSHTIEHFYGSGFNSTGYFDKFFDLRLQLPEIDYDKYINNRFAILQWDYIYYKVCRGVISHFKFTLREIERYILLIQIAGTKYLQNDSSLDIASIQFFMIYILPIIIGLSMKNIKKHKDFIEGKYPTPLIEILLNPNYDINLNKIKSFLDTGEYILNEHIKARENRLENDTDTEIETVKNRLTKIYDALFNKQYDEIGSMEISENTYHKINDIISLLSPDAEYNNFG